MTDLAASIQTEQIEQIVLNVVVLFQLVAVLLAVNFYIRYR